MPFWVAKVLQVFNLFPFPPSFQTDSNSLCQAAYFWLRFFADGLVWAITSRKSAVVIVSNWITGKLLLPKEKRIYQILLLFPKGIHVPA